MSVPVCGTRARGLPGGPSACRQHILQVRHELPLDDAILACVTPRLSSANTAARHIARVDPALEPLIRAVGPFDPRPPDQDAFNSLARAILLQQLAGHAARAIHARFVNLLGGEVTAERVLARSIDDLRSVGLSNAKATSIMDLARKTADGTVALERVERLSDDEIIHRPTTVRGIGRWTAEMFLLFQLRRPDVWPSDDFGL
jgi:DNA-3-methyladenine glycosylase II